MTLSPLRSAPLLPAALVLMAIAAAPAAATPQHAPGAAAQDRAEAARRRSEALSTRLGALGQSIVARERRLAELRETLFQRRRAAAESALRVASARRRLGVLTAAAQRAAREPMASVLAHPDRPLEAARAAMIMRRLSAALAEEQRREREAAAQAAAEASAAAQAEAEALANLDALRAEEAAVDRLRLEADAAGETASETASDAPAAPTREDAARLASAAQRRGEMARAEIDAVETEKARREPAPPPPAPAPAPLATPRPQPAPRPPETELALAPPPPPLVPPIDASRPFAKAKGMLLWPAAGEMRRSRRAGVDGVAFVTLARARVISPWSGVVLVAKDFSSDGKIVIIEPQKGYLVVLDGLASLDLKAGDRVSAGEPLGRMGGAVSSGTEFMVEYSGDPTLSESLYVEIVRKGRPIDPAPWFRSAKKEVSSL